ncbi:positive regulation of cytokinesis [Mactra antiquata]
MLHTCFKAMGTLVDSDIDSFIRGHKAKLQNERAQINQYTDQPRQAQGRQAPSPSNRKQWDRGQRTQPAVEARPQAQPEETGLKFGDGEQDRRKQQLQNERQQEYNDLIKGRLRANRRGPRTPSQEGLPLGQYEQKRKALDKERQLEMQKALEAKASGKPPKSKIFDYAEAEKAHMAEKRKEYNEYLEKKKRESKRHIVTPEDGMFVGPDQSDRNKQIREKSKANRIALEQQQREQLLLKARQMGHIPPHVPRNQVLPRKTEQGRGAIDKLDLSPRQGFDGPDARRPTEPYGHQGNTQYDQNNYVSPKQKPLYLENGSDQPIRDERDDLYAGRGQYERGRARERGDGRDNRRHKSHDRQYDKYDRKLSPPLEVRKSRSLSPPTSPTPALRDLSPPPDRRVPQNDPEKLLEDQKRMLEDLKKRQQILAEEYRREVAEEQRIATEREGQGLAFHESNKQKLGEERKREYQEYLAQKGSQGGKRQVEVLQGSGATLPVGEYDDHRRQQLIEERHREYNEQQQQQEQKFSSRQKGLPPKPPTPNHFFKNIGQHDRTAQMLNEERKKEYNQKLQEDRHRTAGRGPDYGENNTGGLPLKGTDSAEVRKIKTRNAEYNEFLKEKQYKDAHKFDKKKPPQGRHSEPTSPRDKNKDVYGTLPGLHYSDSAEKRKIQERNREYNDYMKQKQGKTRKGWTTPTYEEILEQKRREEALRRQEDEYASSNLRRHASEGAINNLQNDYRAHELDTEFEARKVRFDNERQQPGGILDDDNWLQPERREEQYQQLIEPPRQEIREDMAVRVQPLASLPVGHDESGSAQKRRKSDYRRELELQMEENRARKQREKKQDLKVNASGLLDPEKSWKRVQPFDGPAKPSPRREYKANSVQPYHTKFLLDDRYLTPSPVVYSDYGDDLRLDLGGGGGGGGRERGRRRERDTSLLDPGFTGLLESRRNVGVANPPPGLMYQPSTYVTGGAGGLAGPYSSIDEAYHYYGMKNPLDVENGAGGGGGGGGGLPNLNLGYNDYDRPQVRGSPTPRVTFADDPPTARRRDRSKERISPYQFPSDDDLRSRSRNDTQSYGAELERQIQEKRMQKMREKEEQDRYERKLEEDIKNYNPFGRGGGGAPIKDEGGNAIADLRSLQRGTYQSPRQQQLSHRRQLSPEYSPRPSSPRDDKIGPPPIQQTALGETTHARGGHGIFGQPKTEAEKDQSDKYKDELRQQIAEKRRRAEMEKERERMEEQKEEKRLEEQRLRMQSEYEEEQKKIRAREEEARRKNEELKKQADERKKETERKRREADDARMREQQEQIEREKREQQQREERERVKSPPVPAVKAKTSDDRGTLSPPLPAQRRGRDSPSAVSVKSHRSQPTPAQEPPSSNRPNSSDVLTQLASMRKQLQNERKRVENALENSKNEPDVFDPRTIQRPPPNKLIFENAVNKNASLPPQRAQTTDMANARNIQQFNELKNKTDTDSRRAFRSMFPDAPVTNTTLEAQQDAMIRQQEEQLRSLRERNVYDPTPSNLSFGRRPGNISARSQLASNSAFIDVEGINHFPEDFEDMAGARNDSARARRRAGYSPRPPSGMGSQASLDVDRIQRKNEERLRRLNQMSNTGDDISMGDPDDILDRFMAKQRYNRPPSGQTLQDDSWLRPGSKVV